MRLSSLLIFALLTGRAHAQTPPVPPELFESKAISQVLTLMEAHLMKMRCQPLEKRLSASNGGFFSLKHIARDADICVRIDQPGETRPYFRSVTFEITADQDIVTAFRAKYPIDYKISDSGALAFFEGLARLYEQKALRGFSVTGQTSNVKDGRGIIRRYYRNGPVYFTIEIKLEPDTEPLGSPRSTVISLFTNTEA